MSSIWFTSPHIQYDQVHSATIKYGEELFKFQMDHLGNALLVDDYRAAVNVQALNIGQFTSLIFPDGALISGSYIMAMVSKAVGSAQHKYDDIDLYFKNKSDAEAFAKANSTKTHGFSFDSPMCAYGYYDGEKMNLIYGVEYDSPENLITRFDIRACSMALDPKTGTLYLVEGSVDDAISSKLTFNPVPRGVSVRRLTKYIKKGFELDKYQGLYFAELVRSNIYSPELELLTKDY